MIPDGETRLRGLFPIVMFLGGTWIFVLSKIDSLTSSDLLASKIPCLVYVHIVLTWYLLLGLYLLHRAGIATVVHVDENIIKREWQLTANFFQTWFSAMMACALILLASSFVGNNIVVYLIIFTISFGSMTFFVSSYDAKHALKIMISHVIVMVLFGAFFITAAVLMFSDIEVTLDKKVYSPEDKIVLSVIPSGYVLLPHVVYISYGHDRVLFSKSSTTGPSPKAVITEANKENYNPGYFLIKYKLQVFEIEKTKFVPIAVAPKQQ